MKQIEKERQKYKRIVTKQNKKQEARGAKLNVVKNILKKTGQLNRPRKQV